LAYASGVEFTAVGYTAKDTTKTLLSNNADYSKVAGNGETFLPLLYFAGAVAFDLLVDFAIDKSGSETARNIKDGIDLAMMLTPLGAAKNGGKELVKAAAKEGAEFVSENVAKTTAKTTAKEVAKTTGEVTANLAKTATKETTEALGEKVAKESAKKETKEGVEKSEVKELQLIGSRDPAYLAAQAEKRASEKVVLDTLTDAQKARVNQIDNINHQLISHKNLAGDILDENHIKKLANGKAGLQKATDALQKSLKNPTLSTEQREFLQLKIDESNQVIRRIDELIKTKK